MDLVRTYPGRRSPGVPGEEDTQGSCPCGACGRPEVGFHVGVAWADVVRRGNHRRRLKSLVRPETHSGAWEKKTYFYLFYFIFFYFFLFYRLLLFYFFWIFCLGFDSYTTPPQQVHNTPSHGGGPHTLGSTSCEGVLCTCCGVVVNLSFFLLFWFGWVCFVCFVGWV